MSVRRECAGRTAMLLLVIVPLPSAAGVVRLRMVYRTRASLERHVTATPTPVTGPTPLKCGRPFQPPAAGGLTLTGQFPAIAPAGERAITGMVEVTSREAVRGVSAPRADVFLVRNGRIATVPVAQNRIGVRWNLAPGEPKRLPGEATLLSCDPDGGSVPPGTYQLYARVMIIPDDGTGIECFGGPWSLELR
jgi:hypothetical protein